MILYDANAPGPNPTTVRLFAHERGGLDFDVVTIDLVGLENRRRAYLTEISARGEVPALRLDDGTVLTEITAICGYFDEMARGGRRLCGETAQERAIIHMWTRRAYLEVVLPFVNHWRGSEAAENAYRGHRILQPEARRSNRLLAERGLNQFDDDLDGKDFIAGNDISMADILLFAFMATNIEGEGTTWLNVPQRPHVAAWYERMRVRESAAKMLVSLAPHFQN
ncbi:glutathione S-transferase family protein [Nesterenkonia xinjiangensis]|uniref:Glutathione S-transferase n=1 Tax=Nesterenkonia xinjiangensis TaxID=225327 RepID=A0A7Z0GIN8_9MICC|nr:glutathione S-transferase family protein [Nesterenkonia xinjiangensis]NYJ76720.1 glutathione S-transferase [Nesterenkonia xinjiangensis]